MANVLLTWTGSPTESYEIEYKKSTDNFWISPAGSPVVGTSININNLEDNTNYTFRVRGLCVGNVYTNWIYQSFKTGGASCVAPTGLMTTAISETAISISWTASVTAINGYVVQYKKSDTLNWLTATTTTNTFATILGLESGTTYHVRVVGLCSANAQAATPLIVVTTIPQFTQCENIETNTVVVTEDLGDETYEATWLDAGGIPASHTLEYSIDDGANFFSVTTIVNQTGTTATYTINDVNITVFPTSHQLRVTPVCSDFSEGDPGYYDYEAPEVFTEFITIENALDSGNVSVFRIDGGPNVLPTALAVTDTYDYNQTGLFSGTHSINCNFTSVPNGTKVTVKQIRSGNPILSGTFIYNGSSVSAGSSYLFQDGDIIEFSNPPVMTLTGTVTYTCLDHNDCDQQGNAQLTFNFTSPVPQTTTVKMAIAFADPDASPYPITLYGCDVTGIQPGMHCTSYCNQGYQFVIPAGVTTYTTNNPLSCNGTSEGFICHPCLFGPLSKLFLKSVTSNSVLNLTITNPGATIQIL